MFGHFRNIVIADFEFDFGGHDSLGTAARSGERPRPVCMVARELRSGQTWQLWRGQFEFAPPFPIGTDSLFIAYYASAELGCFLALNWPMPANLLDLFIEFRNRCNGLSTPAGSGLVGALSYFGIDHVEAAEKDVMRTLVLRGGPWTDDERVQIFRYCGSDVAALERLLTAMLSRIDLPRALLRARFMKAAAVMEFAGVPIDTPALALLREYWTAIQDELIQKIDADYGVFEGRSFRADRWAKFLARNGIPWPCLESGRLDLSDDAFRQMAKANSAVSPMRELRSALSDLRLNDLAVGSDHRNRTILSAYRARSGRNAPSNTRFIFGPSVWLRSLIQPPPGHGLAYIDWSQQEFGIAAVLSGDIAMQGAYLSGDPYLAFAKQARAVPADATRQTHAATRELFKTCALGVQYGMEAASLAARIGQPQIVARDLLRAHRETYRHFWKWSDAALDFAMVHGSLHTVFGWQIHVGDNPNPRSLRNFPMQANGAEMLRLACCLGIERKIEICAPVHDAVLICSPLDRLEVDVADMRGAMAEASRIVLDGFELRTDVTRVRYPDRFRDPRGIQMWDQVMGLIAKRRSALAIGTEAAA
jgi:DNA polymerase I